MRRPSRLPAPVRVGPAAALPNVLPDAAELEALIDELAAGGNAIILISSEMPEILNLSTRILVFRAGRVVGELPRAEATQDGLMRLMAGVG